VLLLVVLVVLVLVLVVVVLLLVVLVLALVLLLVRTRLHAGPDSTSGSLPAHRRVRPGNSGGRPPGHTVSQGQPAIHVAPLPQPHGVGARGRWGSSGPPREARPPLPPGLHPPARM